MENNAWKEDNLCGVLKRNWCVEKTVSVLKNCFHKIPEYLWRTSSWMPVPGGIVK